MSAEAAATVDRALAGLDLPEPAACPPVPAGVRRRLWGRFWAKVDRDREGCWVWTGATRAGYGAIKVDGRTVAVHRLSVEWNRGPIPARKVIDHLCANQLCVRPSHLDVTTRLQNIRRGGAPHFEVAS